MSVYVSPDGEYPMHLQDIRRVHPDWQKGDSLPEGWFMVDERLEEEKPDGIWAEGTNPPHVDPETGELNPGDQPVAILIWSNELAFVDDDPSQPYLKWTSEEIPIEDVVVDHPPENGEIPWPERIEE